MTEAEVKKIASEAAKAAVKEMLVSYGIPPDDPLEVQRDFQHLRSWREASETVKKQGLMTAVGIITAGILGLIYMAFKGGS